MDSSKRFGEGSTRDQESNKIMHSVESGRNDSERGSMRGTAGAYSN